MRSGFILTALAAALSAAPALAKLTPWQEAAVLAMHNGERAAVGVGPVSWNQQLAADAERWAAHLAHLDTLMHYGEAGEPDNGEGENLFMGTSRAYSIDQMIGYWTNEKRMFRRVRRWDQSDVTFEAVGHYTQMVWRDTRQVGCGLASNRENDFLVCRYAQPGNVMGQRPY
jgi:hypothetical protein